MASEKREIEIALKSRAAESSADSLNKKVKGIGASADGVVSSFGSLTKVAAAVGAALATGAVARYADAWTKVNNQIKQTTTSTTEALAVQEAIFQIAKTSRVEINGVADAYQRISNSVADFGFSTKDSLDVVEGLTKAFKANGASAEEAASVLVQLGQGLGAGALQGEELKAIMEASLPVSRAIAKEFGVQVGQLKELGAAGELVTERVFKALQNSLPEFQSSFDRASVSIAEGFTVAGTSITRLIGLTDEATGASDVFSGTLIELSNAIDMLGDAVASGAAGKIAEVFGDQLSQIGDDISFTTKYILDIWENMGDQMVSDTNGSTLDISDAFLNIIPNIRNFTQIVTVELAAFVDRVAAYGVATRAAFNPFDDQDVDDARGALGKQIKNIESARDAAIESILAQRETERKAQAEKISDADKLLEAYKRQREERIALLAVDSQISAAFSGTGDNDIFGNAPKAEVKPDKGAGSESGDAAFASLKARLELETQAIQAEAEVRRAFAEGEINQRQLDEELALQNVFFNYESRRAAILENEKLTHEQKTELIAELAQQEIDAEQIKQDQITEKTKQGSDDRTKLELLASNARIDNIRTGASATLSLLSAFGSQSSKTQKKFAIADAIVNIASGVAKALNNPYPANLGFAAQVAAQGAGLLATIKSASPGSSSAPTVPSTSPTVTPTAPSVDNQSQDRIINITGLENFGPNDMIPITREQFENYISESEGVNIAINNGQSNAQRIGAI